MNKIQPGIIPKFNKKENLHILMERENIGLYLEACWKLSLSSTDMFITPDLHSRTNIMAVLNNIVALSDVASCYGNVSVISLRTGQIPLDPRSTVAGVASPRPISASSTPRRSNSRKHVTVAISQPKYIEELQGDEDPEYIVQLQRKEIDSLLLKVQKLEASNQSLIEEVKEIRTKFRETGVTALEMENLKLQRENQVLTAKYGVRQRKLSEAELKGICLEMERLVEKFLDPTLELRREFMEGYVDIHFKDQDIIRRNFAQILRKKFFEHKEGNPFEVNEISFNSLVFLIRGVLDYSDTKDAADVITAKYILQSSFLVYRNVQRSSWFSSETVREECQDVIRSHHFWSNKIFWSEYFWARVSQNRPESESQSGMDSYISTELESFISGMVAWGENTTDSVKELYKDIRKTYQKTGTWKTDEEINAFIESQKHQKSFEMVQKLFLGDFKKEMVSPPPTPTAKSTGAAAKAAVTPLKLSSVKVSQPITKK
eukprot:TRINITY_DN657_c0_g1_i1.p1 TRINITY_DN657_c0_g1~~TRINITY_DN657_c0_g1_i1.p1  ORF type:complete len:488 (+),score=95.80 TRINITY_DN657_c0_g1_i1:308-1771(+)